jgi:WD40 repeat protein
VFTFGGFDDDVMAVAFSPDGKRVVSSGFQPGLYWWDTQTGERVKLQAGHGVAVHEICFSKDGKFAASAGADRTVRMWDGASGAPLKVFAVGATTYAVAVSPDGKRLASGSFDGLVRLWDAASGRQLLTLLSLPPESGRAEWLAVAPEGYAAGSAGAMKLGCWRMGGQELAGEAVWRVLGQPAMLARAAAGQDVPAPSFGK